MPAPRTHAFSTCARGAGIHGDVLIVYTVEREGERVGRGGEGSSSASCFHGKTSVFLTFLEHLNRTLGSSLVDSSAYQKLST